MIGPILAATVVVADLEPAVQAYADLLGHDVLAQGSVDESLAVAWEAAVVTGAPWVLLGPPGAAAGLLRLVQLEGVTAPDPFRTYGWSAHEVLVADLDAVLDRCRGLGGFEVIQEPVRVGGSPALRAFQASGPGGEGIYLTQISGEVPGFEMPTVPDWENRVMAVVAASPHLDETRDYFQNTFGLRRVTDHALPVRVLNGVFDLPEGTLHRISSLQLASSAVLETDQYPDTAVAREAAAGSLPGGLVSATFGFHGSAPPPEAALRRLEGAGEPPYSGRSAWAGRAPFGLRFEIVKA